MDEENRMLLKINQEGVELFQKGEYERAISLFSDIIRRGLDISSVHLNRGMAFYHAGRYGEAVPDLSVGIIPGRTDPKLLLYRGISYYKTGKLQLALDDLSECMNLLKYFYEPLYWMALIFLDMGEYDFALWEARKFIEHEPDNPKGYIIQGNAYFKLGELKKALDCYTEAERLDGRMVEIYINRALVHQEMNNFAAAFADTEKARSMDPFNYKIHMELGNINQEMGNFSDAIKNYTTAINLNRSSWELYNNRGSAYLSSGDIKKAIRDFDMAHNMDMDQALPLLNRARALLLSGIRERAIEDYRKAKEIDPSVSDLPELEAPVELYRSES